MLLSFSQQCAWNPIRLSITREVIDVMTSAVFDGAMEIASGTASVGTLVKGWRARRRLTQLELALRVGVSTRHLSFVETGRSRPSPELVTALGIELDVPLRERNAMLMAAGHAPRYSHTSFDADAAAAARSAVTRILDAHDPFPGVAVDRGWDVVVHNRAAGVLLSLVSPDLAAPPVNVYRISFHPDGLARYTQNLPEWGAAMMRQLRRDVALTGDSRLERLLEEVSRYPSMTGIDASAEVPDQDLVVPFRISVGGMELALFTTLTTFGTPRDITFDELAIELFYPLDDETRAAVEALSLPATGNQDEDRLRRGRG